MQGENATRQAHLGDVADGLERLLTRLSTICEQTTIMCDMVCGSAPALPPTAAGGGPMGGCVQQLAIGVAGAYGMVTLIDRNINGLCEALNIGQGEDKAQKYAYEPEPASLVSSRGNSIGMQRQRR